MTLPIHKIRETWRRGSPPNKLGVTERYVVHAEARRWMLSQLAIQHDDLVLDVGFGHGFLSFELASRTRANVVGMDFLRGDQPRSALRASRLARLQERISWITCDAGEMPAKAGIFDFVLSFLALEDVYMTSGERGLSETLREMVRVLKPGGVLAFADNLFPECVHGPSRELYARIQREEFHAQLPSKKTVLHELKAFGLTKFKEASYDPQIELSAEEARIELSDIVEAKPFGLSIDFDKLWSKYEPEITRVGMVYPSILMVQGSS